MSQASIGERTWIDAQADRFEREWRGGDRPRIEDYLVGQSGAPRDRLLAELLRMERELRQSAGESPDIEEYRARFPDAGAIVDAALGLEAHSPAPPAKPTATAAHSLLLGLLALQNNFIDREALLAGFSAWVADEPVSAWREPMLRRLRRWGRRHRLLVTGAAAAVLVAAGALAVGNVLVARQRNRAERNLAFARRVVDEMYTGVADRLEDQKEMDDWQREILKKALEFYERFALPQRQDPHARLEAARAALRAGAIRRRLGQTAAAELADRRALEILLKLRSDHPSEAAFCEALAQAHEQLGELRASASASIGPLSRGCLQFPFEI